MKASRALVQSKRAKEELTLKQKSFCLWAKQTQLNLEKIQKLKKIERTFLVSKFLKRWRSAREENLQAGRNERLALKFRTSHQKRKVFVKLLQMKVAKKKFKVFKEKARNAARTNNLKKHFKAWYKVAHSLASERRQVRLIF